LIYDKIKIILIFVNQPIAIVMSEVFLRRLTPSLTPFARKMQDYRVLSIHRPIDELGPCFRIFNQAD
jgi:hypothetical protein